MDSVKSIRGAGGVTFSRPFRRRRRHIRRIHCSGTSSFVRTSIPVLRLSRQSRCENAQGTDANSFLFTSSQIKPNGVPFSNGHCPRSNPSPSLTFLCGLQTSHFISDSPGEQTKQTMENIKSILEAAGSSLDRVVKVVIMMDDIQHFNEINEVYGMVLCI